MMEPAQSSQMGAGNLRVYRFRRSAEITRYMHVDINTRRTSKGNLKRAATLLFALLVERIENGSKLLSLGRIRIDLL